MWFQPREMKTVSEIYAQLIEVDAVIVQLFLNVDAESLLMRYYAHGHPLQTNLRSQVCKTGRIMMIKQSPVVVHFKFGSIEVLRNPTANYTPFFIMYEHTS